MKSEQLKCTIVKDTLSLQSDGVLHLKFTGHYLASVKDTIKALKVSVNSPVEIVIGHVNTSKTVKQNNTFHDLLSIYYLSGMPSDLSYDDLKTRIKDTYGVRHEIRMIVGEPWKVLKSWSKYTLDESRKAIDGLISEMLTNGVNDKRFEAMINDWNTFDKAPPVHANPKKVDSVNLVPERVQAPPPSNDLELF